MKFKNSNYYGQCQDFSSSLGCNYFLLAGAIRFLITILIENDRDVLNELCLFVWCNVLTICTIRVLPEPPNIGPNMMRAVETVGYRKINLQFGYL